MPNDPNEKTTRTDQDYVYGRADFLRALEAGAAAAALPAEALDALLTLAARRADRSPAELRDAHRRAPAALARLAEAGVDVARMRTALGVAPEGPPPPARPRIYNGHGLYGSDDLFRVIIRAEALYGHRPGTRLGYCQN